jgi:hypothetical protein
MSYTTAVVVLLIATSPIDILAIHVGRRRAARGLVPADWDRPDDSQPPDPPTGR